MFMVCVIQTKTPALALLMEEVAPLDAIKIMLVITTINLILFARTSEWRMALVLRHNAQ
jgi:hypothetical protein